MAGWLVAWSPAEAPPDAQRWQRSLTAAVRYGGALTEHRSNRVAIAAWRRTTGEFPASGRLKSINGAHVAWVGQCVGEAGDATDESIALVASSPFNDASAARLNGPFIAAVVRSNPFEVRLVTDRHRHYPIYVHRGPDFCIASSEIRCLAPWLARAELERDSIDMLLRCGELIDHHTLLKNVEVLPPGSVFIDSGFRSTSRRYWSMRSNGEDSITSATERLGETLRVGVRRLERLSHRLGITLSGGLDSRIILDLCERPELVPSFTWGLPGCRDIECATEFARLVKSRHVVRHWNPDEFPPLWGKGVDLTGGSCGIDIMFMLPFVELLASNCDIVFNGLAGDVILGGNWVKQAWLKEENIEQLGRAVWRWRVAERDDLLADRLTERRSSGSSAGDRWVASIADRDGGRPIERVNDWLLENRIFRTTNCGTMLLRGGVESHSPFFDRDFIDALCRVQQDHKYKHRLYLAVMNRIAPRAASVPWQRTNIRPRRGFYANLAAMAVQRVARRAAQPFGIEPFPHLAVADPAGWLRGTWSKSIENLLFSDRFRDRNLVNADVLREVWRSHIAGEDHSRQLSVLVAVEHFARAMTDGTIE